MKQHLLKRYKEMVQDRIDVFQSMISELSSDAENDAKSSAGDKHETALSMMHLEQEKLNQKLKELHFQISVLDKIDVSRVSQKIILGSLVKVNDLTVFISVALPKIQHENITIFAISPESPLGSKLMGNEVGGSFEINTVSYTIKEVL